METKRMLKQLFLGLGCVVVCLPCRAFYPQKQPMPQIVLSNEGIGDNPVESIENHQSVQAPVKKKAKGKKQLSKKKKTVAKKKVIANKKKAVAKGKNKKAAVRKKQVAKKRTQDTRYITLKTNVPFLAVAVSNLAVEARVHKHITVDFPVMWSISDIEWEHAVRGIAFQPEGRWWLEKAGIGHFFGLHAHAAWFNLKWEDMRYQTAKRPLLGAGISYGYKLPLGKHWGAEFTVGAGYANMKYDTYYNIENGAKIDTRVRHYWGITRAGISLVYRF